MRPLVDYRFGIGPMSKNVVDACIAYSNGNDVSLMLIPSRRQIEWNGGYVNNWTTKSFPEYVGGRTTGNVLLMRDHAGPQQGQVSDSGFDSLRYDCNHFDLIHLDPWKAAEDFQDGCAWTKQMIDFCFKVNPFVQYEIGTEESIFRYDAEQLRQLLNFLRRNLSTAQFDNIRFAVIQSGTSLKGNENTGTYDAPRLMDMLAVCRDYGVLSKAHNGDYLPVSLIAEKFRLGLNAINIAPEFGQIETQIYLEAIGQDEILLDKFYKMCFNSGRWKKWISEERALDKVALINVCGHYVFSDPLFLSDIKSYFPDIDNIIKIKLTEKLDQLFSIA